MTRLARPFSLSLLVLAVCAGAAWAEMPVRRGDVYVYSDGVQVRATDPSGRAGVASADGSIRWADGTRVRHDTATGETRITHADGRVDVRDSHAPRREGDTFVWPDGTRVRATDPSGRAGQIKADGTIVYSDGTRVSHDMRSGDTKFVHRDGRVEVIPGGAPRRDGDHFVWSDGTRVRGTDPHGNPGKIGPDGVVTFADGTRVSHDTRTGDTKMVGADGSVRLINTRSGTDKTFPPGTAGDRRNTGSGTRGKHDERAALALSGSGHRNDGHRNDNRSGASGRNDHPIHTNTGASATDNKNTGHGHAGGNSNAGHGNSNAGHGNSNASANNNSSNSNSNSNSSNSNDHKNSGNDNKATASDTKPANDHGGKAGADKGTKGRTVAGYEHGMASGPRLRVGGLATNPSPDQSTGRGSPKLTAPGVSIGPGGRPGGASAATGPLLRLPAGAIVVNPSQERLVSGPHAPKPIDPYGGRR